MVLQSGVHKRIRVAHVLKRAGSKRLPQRMIFFDVETEPVNDEGDQRMSLLVACYWFINNKTGVESVEWFNTRSKSKFYAWVLSHLKHNIATRLMSANIWFDFRTSGLYKHLKKHRWQCVGLFNKGHTHIIKFKLNNWRLEFVNIQNYFNFPVAVIGQSIGLPKLSVDFATTNKKDLLAYCKRDVEIIFEAFRNLYLFVKENDFGNLPYTMPSLSFGFFTHSFMKHKLFIHNVIPVLHLERQSYFGGRCECFFIGKLSAGKYYKVDVNAMYPFVMKSRDYPIKYLKAGKNVDPAVVIKTAPLYCFIAECEIETKIPIYAKHMDGKLKFPIGRFITTLTTPTLLYGIEHGHVKKVLKLAVYKKGVIFKGFVDYFYNKRLEFKRSNNVAFGYVCKLLLNSLYGKFGQRTSQLVYAGVNKKAKDIRRLIIDRDTHKTSIHQVFFGRETITDQEEEEAHNSMPAVSAHVTDYARLYLWSLIEKAGFNNCFYCDTDSIIVNETGLKRLHRFIDPVTIGMLKVEAVSSNVQIKGAKNYVFGTQVKIKGIPKKAKRNKDGSFTYPHFPGMIEELRRGVREDYRIEVQTKYLSGNYDKGIVTKSGRVKPFTLKDWQ